MPNFVYVIAVVAALSGLALLAWPKPLPFTTAYADQRHDKLGWLDDAEFTAADRTRVASLTGYDTQEGWVRSMQAGVRSGITRRDIELLRQDRRRARAAYPDVKSDDLTNGIWLTANESAKIPSAWGGGNSNGIKGKDGKWYLDGGFYVGVVKPQYTERASASVTKEFFAGLKAKERAANLETLRKDGPSAMWGGSGGSMSVRLDKKTGQVVVIRAKEWASTAQQWTMPFVPDEWADIYAGDLEAIKRLPSFAHAVESEIKVTPSGVSFIGAVGSVGTTHGGASNGAAGGSGSSGFVLKPGESVSVGISAPIQK